MKAKKALKRLTRVETLLTDVIDQYTGSRRDVRELLDDAKASVVRAKKTVNVKPSARSGKEPPVKPGNSKSQITTEGRKKLSSAAIKQSAVAKRKGIGAVTGRSLSKTA